MNKPEWLEEIEKAVKDPHSEWMGDAVESVETLLSALNKAYEALELIKPALDVGNNECTSHPWWGIVRKGSFGRYTMLAGPFFSRQSATEFQQRQAHNLPKNTLVYCYSGQYCSGKGDWVHFLDAAREALSFNPLEVINE